MKPVYSRPGHASRCPFTKNGFQHRKRKGIDVLDAGQDGKNVEEIDIDDADNETKNRECENKCIEMKRHIHG